MASTPNLEIFQITNHTYDSLTLLYNVFRLA